MSILTIHPADTNQETAIKLFLDALHVAYKTSEESDDDTTYLMKSPAMVAQLNKAAEEEQKGMGVNISLDDIWK